MYAKAAYGGTQFNNANSGQGLGVELHLKLTHYSH
jgi:hypothetical protein